MVSGAPFSLEDHEPVQRDGCAAHALNEHAMLAGVPDNYTGEAGGLVRISPYQSSRNLHTATLGRAMVLARCPGFGKTNRRLQGIPPDGIMPAHWNVIKLRADLTGRGALTCTLPTRY